MNVVPTSDQSAKPTEVLPTHEGYNLWAEVYDTEQNPLVLLEEPLVETMMGDVRGLAVLDVGCGTGRHALQLAKAGAQVQAIDFSQGMLERARAKAGSLPVNFVGHDLARRLPFADVTFDRVVCGLVLDHVVDLHGIFSEMKRVCRGSGFIVVSNMHPAMMLRGVQARFHDQARGVEVRPQSCPHQLSDYVLAAARAGLTFDHLSENAVDEALASRSERARRYLGWPMLFLMQLSPAAERG